MVKINELTLKLIEKIISDENSYGAKVNKLSSGQTVIDMTDANREGGKIVSEICMGGLGNVGFTNYDLEGQSLDAVDVKTSEPIISCMASQLAGWSVKLKKEVEKDGKLKKKVVFQSLGSGPARAKAKVEKKLYEELNYSDDSDCAIIVFESRKMPDEEVMAIITDKCNVAAEKTYAVCAPTACLTGSIQVSARVVETGIHKLHELHFPLEVIKEGTGIAPIAPIAKDDFAAMGTTNDSIIAVGTTVYTMEIEEAKEAELFDMIKKAPANQSSSYGQPFNKIFKEANYDFYKIDPGLFAPAVYTVKNTVTGNTITEGKINNDLLKQSYGL
jgi:methenyltetrahydromethanopterin cyclohydrolase